MPEVAGRPLDQQEKPASQELSQPSAPLTMPSVPPVNLPAPQAVDAPQVSVAQPVDTNPQIAADDDVIEKEWVDKAKKIVADTKIDPYAQEREVSRLQADYIKKRYGKEIKLSDD